MRSGFFDQVTPSAEPQIDTSSDSCSICSVRVRRQRNVRVGLAEMSNAAPSPLASRRVSRGGRLSFVGILGSRARILAQGDQLSGQSRTLPARLSTWWMSVNDAHSTQLVLSVQSEARRL